MVLGECLRGLFPSGMGGGSGPFRMDCEFGQVITTMYYRVRMKHSANFTDNGNTGTKFGFFLKALGSPDGGTNHYFGFNGGTTDDFRPMSGFQFSQPGPTSVTMEANNPIGGPIYKAIPLDTFRTYELLIIGNSAPGVADGTLKLWVDGTLMINRVGNRLVWHDGAGRPTGFLGVTWNPTYGGGFNPVPEDMYMYVSDWYVSGS